MPRPAKYVRLSALALGALARAALVLAAVALSGCTLYPISAKPAKLVQRTLDRQYGPDAPGRPSVFAFCYGRIFNSRAEVLEEARNYCGGIDPIPQDQDVIWTPCPLLQPVRLTFICRPKPSPPAAGPEGETAPEAKPTPEAE